MSARETILSRIRACAPKCVEKPDLTTIAKISFEDRVAKFAEMVAIVGGKVEYVEKNAVETLAEPLYCSKLAVAENGAVWLPCKGDRRDIFACEHLHIVVDAADIVDTMHDAMARIELEGYEFGVFVSGPSKTADIEQALVLGAHGAMHLTVYIVKS